MFDDDYLEMCSKENLQRAYKWIQSNPDYYYKSFFRDSYNAYAAASGYNLKRLRRSLLNQTYESSHAAKIYIPKPSGILRPITLLTVNDQIVYQACINIIADRLKPLVKKRYEKVIFGHLYAGKASPFFYMRWQRGYRKFSRAVHSHVGKGFDTVANFDLASFYDTIDHEVIQFFLAKIHIEEDLTNFLLKCLKQWTCCTWTNIRNPIYHGHGIPQGPLSSGLLSEIVLMHLDDKGAKEGRTSKYLRYVDDIKLFAKTEGALKRRLISLDLAAKDVGLFPQSSKINIRKVKNPKDEVKVISQMIEEIGEPAKNQSKVVSNLLQMTRHSIVDSPDVSGFKFLLSQANPTHKLNLRLLAILSKQPHLSRQIAYYFAKYDLLPKKAAEKIAEFLEKEEIYHSVHADVLMATLYNMPSPYKEQLVTFCYNNFYHRHKNLPPLQPTYHASIVIWLLLNGRLNYEEYSGLLLNEKNWWIQKETIKYVKPEQYGLPSYEFLLNRIMKNKYSPDATRFAAMQLVDNNLKVIFKDNELATDALPTLFAGGKVKRFGRQLSLVALVFEYVLGLDRGYFNWQLFFGAEHSNAERIAFTIKHQFETDMNACLVTLDSLCDLSYRMLFNKFAAPGKQYGDYGGMFTQSDLKARFPITVDSFKDLHLLRKQSHTAHPKIKNSIDQTRRLKHKDFRQIKPKLLNAYQEIQTKFFLP
jgi:hypothetical protein